MIPVKSDIKSVHTMWLRMGQDNLSTLQRTIASSQQKVQFGRFLYRPGHLARQHSQIFYTAPILWVLLGQAISKLTEDFLPLILEVECSSSADNDLGGLVKHRKPEQGHSSRFTQVHLLGKFLAQRDSAMLTREGLTVSSTVSPGRTRSAGCESPESLTNAFTKQKTSFPRGRNLLGSLVWASFRSVEGIPDRQVTR